jgi:hypothetical protein
MPQVMSFFFLTRSFCVTWIGLELVILLLFFWNAGIIDVYHYTQLRNNEFCLYSYLEATSVILMYMLNLETMVKNEMKRIICQKKKKNLGCHQYFRGG